jgi:hypothetical protein
LFLTTILLLLMVKLTDTANNKDDAQKTRGCPEVSETVSQADFCA